MASERIAELHRQIEIFRRRFYLNRIIHGSLISLLLILSLLVFFSITEGLLWLGPGLKTFLFVVAASLLLACLGGFVVVPVLLLYKLRQGLDEEDSARLIGEHFPEVADRLLNVLQLDAVNQNDSSLIKAAIDKRTAELEVVPFRKAVNLRVNLRYLRFLAIPVVVVLLVLAINPSVFTQGTYRFLHFREPFQKPAPYTISVNGDKPQVIGGEGFTLDISVAGDEIPSVLYLYQKREDEDEYHRYSLTRSDAASYQFAFENLVKGFTYFIGNELYRSEYYSTDVLLRPSIASFQVQLSAPAYTGGKSERLDVNQGDIAALRGSVAQWEFSLQGAVQQASFLLNGKAFPLVATKGKPGAYTISSRLMQSGRYSVSLVSTKGVGNVDTVQYQITVMDDKYPSVLVNQPSADAKVPTTGIVTVGATAADDFGLSRSVLRYHFTKTDDPLNTTETWIERPIDMAIQGKEGSILADVDVISLGLVPGDVIEYVVRVWDTDRVSGPKYTDSPIQTIAYQSQAQLYSEVDNQNNSSTESLQSLQSQTEEVNKSIEELNRRLLDKKNLSYEDKQELEILLKEQTKIQEQIDNAQKALMEQLEYSKENQLLTPKSEEELQKLNELLEQVKDPAYQEFLKDLQEQIGKLNKRNTQQLLEQMQQQNQTQQQALERTLELYKKWQAEQKVNEILQRLEQLEQRQDLLNQQLEQSKTGNEQQKLAEKQQELTEELQKLQQELDKLEKLQENSGAEKPEDTEELKEAGEQAEQEMQQSQEQLQQRNKRKASDAQKRAQQQLQQMQQKLSSMQQESQEQQEQENYEDLRALLENLLKLSFEQESLRDEVSVLRYNDPAMNGKVQQQKRLQDDLKMIDDSLVALSKRVFQIQQFVLTELKSARGGMDRSTKYLAEKYVSRANASQQQVMTNLNNLANMLVQSLSQMQQQMQQQGNPQQRSGNRPGMQQLIQMQQQLNQQLQQEGQLTPGEQQQLAKQQEAIRKQLQEMYEKLNGERAGGLQKAMEEMEETEQELLKQQLTKRTLERQQQILNRMLDYDKAMREREFEEKRKSNTGNEQAGQRPEDWDAQQQEQSLRKEQLQRGLFRYAPAYQGLIDSYYNYLISPTPR